MVCRLSRSWSWQVQEPVMGALDHAPQAKPELLADAPLMTADTVFVTLLSELIGRRAKHGGCWIDKATETFRTGRPVLWADRSLWI